jgi:hypothetical protein
LTTNLNLTPLLWVGDVALKVVLDIILSFLFCIEQMQQEMARHGTIAAAVDAMAIIAHMGNAVLLFKATLQFIENIPWLSKHQLAFSAGSPLDPMV